MRTMHVPVLGRGGFPLKISIFNFRRDCHLQEAPHAVGYFININRLRVLKLHFNLKKHGLN